MSRPRLGHSEHQRRVEEGAIRNVAWHELTTDQKINNLLLRRGESKRQLAKLRAIGGKK